MRKKEYDFSYNPDLLPYVVQTRLNLLADDLFGYDKRYHKKITKILNKCKKDLIKFFRKPRRS